MIFPKLSQEITNYLDDIDSLVQRLSTLQHEKDNISFFAIKRKKEKEEEIYNIKKKIDELEQGKHALEQQCKGYLSIKEINRKIEENIQKISEYKKDLNDLKISRTKEEIIEELTQYDFGKLLTSRMVK